VSEEVVRRGLWLVKAVQDHALKLDETSTVLELGTGWQHFYALFLRLFYAPRILLFDIQDNRQFASLSRRFAQLAGILPDALPAEWASRRSEIAARARQIAAARSFEELYASLGMVYYVEPDGRLDFLADHSVDVVFSMDVLEHVARPALPDLSRSVSRILRPGGLSIHQIGLDDHLAHYAPGMASKHYLIYSDRIWRLMFENGLQYFNRIQMSDFDELFAQPKFVLLECAADRDAHVLRQLRPHRQYQRYDVEDLTAIRGYLIHRRAIAE
jgi:cyclopropane fatty-acyl-phospholipid synthase-like methyltransferase